MHLAAMDLNLAVILRALLTERSVSLAAKQLGLSPSATSHALSRLRDALGDPLFIRTRQGLAPTPRGEAIAGPLSAALDLLEKVLLPEPEFDARTANRRVLIAATDYAEFLLLPPLLRVLAARSPEIRVWVRPLAAESLTALRRGEIDLAIGVFPPRELEAGLHTAPLLEDRLVCMMRKQHPLARGRLTLARFLSAQHALIAPRGVPGGPVDEALAARGCKRTVAVTVPHFMVAPHIVAETDLVLTLAERVARAFAGTLPVRIVEPPLDLPGTRLSMVWHDRLEMDASHRWLRARLAEVAAHTAPARPLKNQRRSFGPRTAASAASAAPSQRGRNRP